LSWTRATPVIFKATGEYTDIVFSAVEGDLHWVLTPNLAGAYQYFVNRALPTLGEFRTLWRLDNATFTHGYTSERNEALVPLKEIRGSGAKKVQDETWQRSDGSYITKYDLSVFLPNIEGDLSFWGLHGHLNDDVKADKVGSWYIHGGKDYMNGDHLKQELMVHRESITGDAVQLNMIHGSHFQAYSNDSFRPEKIWGPWLWYLVR
jgi:rhamnogalacturonan endolyase